VITKHSPSLVKDSTHKSIIGPGQAGSPLKILYGGFYAK